MLNRLAVGNLRAASLQAKAQVLSLSRAGDELTPALAAILPPIAAMALALSVWALCAQMAVAANFPVSRGLLADWRVWLVIAAAIEIAAFRARSGGSGKTSGE